MPLLDNQHHEIFAQNLARGKPQLEAYTIAGYIENAGNASKLAAEAHIQDRVRELKSIIAARSLVSADRVLAELARIGFADITEAVRIVDGKVQVVDTAQLSPDLRAAMSEISQGRDGIKVKLHDKRAALENLGKHLGLFKENIDLNVNVSLADLVNGSYKLERGELAPDPIAQAPAIEHKSEPEA